MGVPLCVKTHSLGMVPSPGNVVINLVICVVPPVIFHVATLMPNRDTDPGGNSKKMHIGNNFVTIIYNDSDEEVKFGTIKVGSLSQSEISETSQKFNFMKVFPWEKSDFWIPPLGTSLICGTTDLDLTITVVMSSYSVIPKLDWEGRL